MSENRVYRFAKYIESEWVELNAPHLGWVHLALAVDVQHHPQLSGGYSHDQPESV
jgi:hypothetical protein